MHVDVKNTLVVMLGSMSRDMSREHASRELVGGYFKSVERSLDELLRLLNIQTETKRN